MKHYWYSPAKHQSYFWDEASVQQIVKEDPPVHPAAISKRFQKYCIQRHTTDHTYRGEGIKNHHQKLSSFFSCIIYHSTNILLMMIKNRGAGVELLAAKSFSCRAISFNQPTRPNAASCVITPRMEERGRKIRDEQTKLRPQAFPLPTLILVDI